MVEALCFGGGAFYTREIGGSVGPDRKESWRSLGTRPFAFRGWRVPTPVFLNTRTYISCSFLDKKAQLTNVGVPDSQAEEIVALVESEGVAIQERVLQSMDVKEEFRQKSFEDKIISREDSLEVRLSSQTSSLLQGFKKDLELSEKLAETRLSSQIKEVETTLKEFRKDVELSSKEFRKDLEQSEKLAETRLSSQIKEVETKLSSTLNESRKDLELSEELAETRLSSQIKEVETKLSSTLNESRKDLELSEELAETRLSSQIKEVETKLSSTLKEFRKDVELSEKLLRKDLESRTAFIFLSIVFLGMGGFQGLADVAKTLLKLPS